MAQTHEVRVIVNKMFQERERRAQQKIQEKISHRQEANKELIQNLSAYVEMYPDLRFGQILEGFGFVVEDTDKNGYYYYNFKSNKIVLFLISLT